MKWRIYYADGSTFDGEGTPNIPLEKRFQVQVILQPDHDHHHQALRFADYYYWRSDKKRWHGVEGTVGGMMAYTIDAELIPCFLWGSYVDPATWQEIERRALCDSEFPVTGTRKHDVVN